MQICVDVLQLVCELRQRLHGDWDGLAQVAAACNAAHVLIRMHKPRVSLLTMCPVVQIHCALLTVFFLPRVLRAD